MRTTDAETRGQGRRLRILISAARLGVAGGNQRAVQSWLRALDGHDLSIAARHFHDGPYAQLPPGANAIPSWQIVRPLARRPQTYWRAAGTAMRPRGHFDAYLHFWGGRDLSTLIPAQHRFLIPSGANLQGMEASFDAVLSQSPGGIALLEDPKKHLVVPPPTFPLASTVEHVDDLPEKFLLTVLNPYGEVKGAAVLAEVAARSNLPIVWARSSHTDGRMPMVDVPRSVICLLDLRPAQLLDLYERCVAYVSFSLTEGYGWAIADALNARKPVISRRVGVLTLFPEYAAGLYLYEAADQLAKLLENTTFEQPSFDLGPIEPAAARSTLERLCA